MEGSYLLAARAYPRRRATIANSGRQLRRTGSATMPSPRETYTAHRGPYTSPAACFLCRIGSHGRPSNGNFT